MDLGMMPVPNACILANRLAYPAKWDGRRETPRVYRFENDLPETNLAKDNPKQIQKGWQQTPLKNNQIQPLLINN